jgi:hypothetical protein
MHDNVNFTGELLVKTGLVYKLTYNIKQNMHSS